jgi:hypothetical protein
MSIVPTPSCARAASIELSQSPLLAAMFDAGLKGGKIPSAPAGTEVTPALMDPTAMTPIGSKVATRRRTR